MALDFVPAPGRQFRTYSMLIAIFIGSFDAITLMLKVFADIHIFSGEALLGINAVLSFLIVIAKLFQQYIPLTTDQKIDMIQSAVDQPVKPGEDDVRAVPMPIVI